MMRMEAVEDQPEAVEIKMADGIFVKQMALPRKDMCVIQHVHKHDHTSMVATGAVRVWRNGFYVGDFKAPTGIMIVAGISHQMQALEDGTLVYCIHNISRSGEVEFSPAPTSVEFT